MVFLLPALALTALGLGVKHALDGDLAFAPGDAAWRSARAAHREALLALREARLHVRTQALALAERQRAAVDDTVRPFLELLERLERWECLRPEDRLPSATDAALRALAHRPTVPFETSLTHALWSAATRPEAPPPSRLALGTPQPEELSLAEAVLGAPARREEALAQALLGAASAALAPPYAGIGPLLGWLERGWVHEEAPVRVQGVSVYAAVAPGEVTPAARDSGAHALRLAQACEELAQVRAWLEALAVRLQAHVAQLADLHGCATAQLAYLDAQSFEQDCDELPRARLRRLGALLGALAAALQQPLLEPSGALAAPPAPLPLSLPELA
jgi:hypothetical protein